MPESHEVWLIAAMRRPPGSGRGLLHHGCAHLPFRDRTGIARLPPYYDSLSLTRVRNLATFRRFPHSAILHHRRGCALGAVGASWWRHSLHCHSYNSTIVRYRMR